MELKLLQALLAALGAFVLIVPYGIETMGNNSQQADSITVLIVPYGIETH